MIAALLFIGTACNKAVLKIKGNGNVTTETRAMSSFDRIDNEGDFEVYIIQDSVYEVTIEAESNLISHVRTNISGSTLEIDTDDNLKQTYPIKITVRTPVVYGVSLSGSGLVDVGQISTESMDIGLSGSGNISGAITAENVYVGISGSGSSNMIVNCNTIETYIGGSGDMYFSGIGNIARFNISGSGAVKAYDFPVKECYTNVSGSGNMYLNVSEVLNVDISGSGSVYYIGYPAISTNITGSGSIISSN